MLEVLPTFVLCPCKPFWTPISSITTINVTELSSRRITSEIFWHCTCFFFLCVSIRVCSKVIHTSSPDGGEKIEATYCTIRVILCFFILKIPISISWRIFTGVVVFELARMFSTVLRSSISCHVVPVLDLLDFALHCCILCLPTQRERR